MKKCFLFFIIFCCLGNKLTFVYANNKDIEITRENLKSFLNVVMNYVGDNYDIKNKDANDSLKGKIISYMANAEEFKDYNYRYKILKTAAKNTKAFEKSFPYIYNNNEEFKCIFKEMSIKLKNDHPDKINSNKTIMFSQMESFINRDASKLEINDVDFNNISGIEDEMNKFKNNKELHEKLTIENNILKLQLQQQNELHQKAIETFMEKEIALKLENEKMKLQIQQFENQQNNAKNFDNLHGLYKQITSLYQKLIKSKDDFDLIIKLRKQINQEENNEKK